VDQVAPTKSGVPDLEEEECGCCLFIVGSSYVIMACEEHGGGSRTVDIYGDGKENIMSKYDITTDDVERYMVAEGWYRVGNEWYDPGSHSPYTLKGVSCQDLEIVASAMDVSVSHALEQVVALRDGPQKPRTVNLDQVMTAAERAEDQVSEWPEWKRNLSQMGAKVKAKTVQAAEKAVSEVTAEGDRDDLRAEVEQLREERKALLQEVERLRIKAGPDEMLEGDYATLLLHEEENKMLRSHLRALHTVAQDVINNNANANLSVDDEDLWDALSALDEVSDTCWKYLHEPKPYDVQLANKAAQQAYRRTLTLDDMRAEIEQIWLHIQRSEEAIYRLQDDLDRA